ncbi:hypothetical protein ACFSCX_11055 [Bacillus salitolerans]|uniref:Uncharacterized protein n=1 Tax=Bacillus salitolerans TaxID=1437434 RepID=A0ABW4LPI4_9BACI
MNKKVIKALEEHLLGITIAFLIALLIFTLAFDYEFAKGVIPSFFNK